ncbi:MAG: pilus assembly protein TadG-related protein [Candidatus Melainabacteria bacterium]|nr:pilus assembly protein TadG-related protein [Candidatus Melainabacteria bacterium]
MLKSKKIRDQKGAAVTWLVLCLMMFILMCGLFAFDASRVQMAQRELTATCDAAALAGTAMLTSYDVSNDTGPPASAVAAGQKLLDAQNNSGAYAYNMFLMGNVLGQWVRPQTTLVSNLGQLSTTTDGECKVCIGLVDPQNGYSSVAPVVPGNAAGTAIGVYAGYGYHPAFISFFGVGNVGIRAASVGGLPQVDAVLVLDLSGSMDDLTPITLVKRYWDAHRGSTFGEPEPATGYTGSNPDTLGWADDSTVARGYINTLIGGSPAPYADLAAFTTLPGGDIGSQPGWASMVNGSAEKNGGQDNQLDFNEFSGRGCVTYLEAPHPNTNQSIIEYMGLDTATYLTGTSLNALPPQNLQFTEKGTVLTGNNVLVFKPFLRHSPDTNDFNQPPGNCPLLRSGPGGGIVKAVNFGWAIGPGTARCSPYKNYLFDHLHYPPAPASGMVGNAPQQYPQHGVIYTDLVVNFGAPTNGTKAAQPAWGPNIFQPVNFTFGGSAIEDDTVIQGQTYNFPNIAVLTEAARGNLDSPGLSGGNNFNNTMLHRGYHLLGGEPSLQNYYGPNATGMNSNAGLVSPRVGYQRAYQRLAMWYSQPVATTLDSCDQAFFQRLTALTDCRFGLVGFSDRWTISGNPSTSVSSANTGVFGSTAYYTATGPSANSYYTDIGFQSLVDQAPRVWDGRLAASTAACVAKHECRVDQSVGGGQGIGFRLPRFALNSSLTKAQCLRTMQKGDVTTTYAWSDPNHGNGLYNGRPLNGTMCSEALETARLSFQTAPYSGAQRAGSKRAIVFFTDGVPVPSSEAGPSASTADACKNDGVAIFSIGLNMLGNGDLTSQQTTFLGNGSGGLSGRAKNGGRFFMCNDVTQVQQAFSSIARRLTQSQK